MTGIRGFLDTWGRYRFLDYKTCAYIIFKTLLMGTEFSRRVVMVAGFKKPSNPRILTEQAADLYNS